MSNIHDDKNDNKSSKQHTSLLRNLSEPNSIRVYLREYRKTTYSGSPIFARKCDRFMIILYLIWWSFTEYVANVWTWNLIQILVSIVVSFSLKINIIQLIYNCYKYTNIYPIDLFSLCICNFICIVLTINESALTISNLPPHIQHLNDNSRFSPVQIKKRKLNTG